MVGLDPRERFQDARSSRPARGRQQTRGPCHCRIPGNCPSRSARAALAGQAEVGRCWPPARSRPRGRGLGVGGGLDPPTRPTPLGQGPACGHSDDPRRPGRRGGDLHQTGQPGRHDEGPGAVRAGRGVRPAATRRRGARRAAMVAGPGLRVTADRHDPRTRAGGRHRDHSRGRGRRLLGGADRGGPSRVAARRGRGRSWRSRPLPVVTGPGRVRRCRIDPEPVRRRARVGRRPGTGSRR